MHVMMNHPAPHHHPPHPEALMSPMPNDIDGYNADAVLHPHEHMHHQLPHHQQQQHQQQQQQHPHKRQRVRSRGGSMDLLFDFDDGMPMSDFLGAVPADPMSASYLPMDGNDDSQSADGALRWDDNQSLLSGAGPDKFTVTTPDHLIRMSQRWERMARRGEMCDMELVLSPHAPAQISSTTSNSNNENNNGRKGAPHATASAPHLNAASGLTAASSPGSAGAATTGAGGDARKVIVPLHSVFACACSTAIAEIVKSNEVPPGTMHHAHRDTGSFTAPSDPTRTDGNNNNNSNKSSAAAAASSGSSSSSSKSSKKKTKTKTTSNATNKKTGGGLTAASFAHSPSNSVSGETEAYESSTCSSKGSTASAFAAGAAMRAGNSGSTKGLMLANAMRGSAGAGNNDLGRNLRVSTRLHLGQPRISIEVHSPHIDEEAAVSVRTYMYTGIVNFRPEVMVQILHLALILDMKPLVELSSGYLMSNLATNFVFETIQVASAFNLQVLREAACEFVMRHFDTCTQHPGWTMLPLETLQAILRGDDIHTQSEIMVFRALVAWTTAAESLRTKDFVDMALDPDLMRLSNMTRDELFEMSNHKLISESKDLRRALYNEAMQRIQTTGVAPPSGANLPAAAKRKVSKPRRYAPVSSAHIPSRAEEVETLTPLIANRCEHTVAGFAHPVCALAHAGNFLAAASSNSIFIYRVSDWQLVTTLHGHDSTVVSLRALPDRLISASPDRTIRVWSAETWECLHVVPTPKSSVCTMIVHEDKLITGSDDGALKSWSLNSWNLLRNVSAHQHVIWALATYGKDTLITGSSDTTIKVWSICRKGGFQAVCTLDSHRDEVQALAVDHSRGWLLSGSDDGCINIHDCKTWEPLRSISCHGRAVLSLVSYGNRIVAGHGNGTVSVWDKDEVLQSEEVLTSLVEHKSCVMALQAIQGKLVTASFDRTIRIWGP